LIQSYDLELIGRCLCKPACRQTSRTKRRNVVWTHASAPEGRAPQARVTKSGFICLYALCLGAFVVQSFTVWLRLRRARAV